MLLSLDSLEDTRLEVDHADSLRARATYGFTFAAGQLSIGIAMCDEAAANDFRYRFGDMVVEREPDYTFFVVEDARRVYFWSDPARARVWTGEALGPWSRSFLADNAVMSDFFARDRYVGLHAALLGGENGLCAVVGATTAGKTTTAVACTRRGMRFYSDERCILLGGEAFPFPRALTLRAGGRALLAFDASGDAAFVAAIGQWGDAPEVVVRPSQFFPGRIGAQRDVLRVIFVLDGTADRPSAIRAPLPTVVPQFAESMSPASSGLDRVARILSTFKSIDCYRLRLGRPDDTARLIADVMASDERAR